MKKQSLVAAATRVFKGRFQFGQFDRDETPVHSPTYLSMNTTVFNVKEREGARRKHLRGLGAR